MRARTEREARRTARLRLRCAALLALWIAPGCGREVRYHPGNVKRSEGRRPWIGALEEGYWTYWYPNAALREQGRYVHGRREGTWEQWYPTGAPRSRGRRAWNEATQCSARVGTWIFWHENGVRQSVGVFRDGRREGHWDYNHVDGSLDGDQTGEYHDDVRLF